MSDIERDLIEKYLEKSIDKLEDIKNFSSEEKYDVILKLLEDNIELNKLALKDSLTNLYNRRVFKNVFRDNISRANRGTPFTLLYMDLDNFKKVNDTYGHQKEDQVLKEIGISLNEITRNYDKAFRIGGDEFAVQLEDTFDITGELAERIYDQIKDEGLKKINVKGSEVDISIGSVCYRGKSSLDITEVSENILSLAEKLMYSAKKNDIKILITEYHDKL